MALVLEMKSCNSDCWEKVTQGGRNLAGRNPKGSYNISPLTFLYSSGVTGNKRRKKKKGRITLGMGVGEIFNRRPIFIQPLDVLRNS